METKKERASLSDVPSLVLAIITAFLSLVLGFFLGYTVGYGFGYISMAIVILIPCFFICKWNPKSVWYVPIICNIMGIISAIVETTFWITDLWLFICGGWVLSLIGAIVGAMVGKRSNLRVKPK